MAASEFEKAAAFFHSRTSDFPHARILALENSSAREFQREPVDFSRQQVLKWALGSVCNIFWYFIHEYTLFFVCPGLALGW